MNYVLHIRAAALFCPLAWTILHIVARNIRAGQYLSVDNGVGTLEMAPPSRFPRQFCPFTFCGCICS